MTDRLPYEDEMKDSLQDLPLPDENQAWADMARRLKEEDDDDPITPLWLRGCLPWGMLGLLLVWLGWWIVKPMHFFKKENNQVAKTGEVRKNETGNVEKISVKKDTSFVNHTQPQLDSHVMRKESMANHKIDTATLERPGKETTIISTSLHGLKKIKGGSEKIATVRRRKNQAVGNHISEDNISHNKITGTIRKKVSHKKRNEQGVKEKADITKNKTTSDQPDRPPVIVQQNPPPISNEKKNNVTVSGQPITQNEGINTNTSTVVIDTLLKKDSVVKTTNPPPVDSSMVSQAKKKGKKSTWHYEAGLGLQQQLPVNGQQTVPYNAQGRKGSLADYIPSLYGKAIKGKWSVQLGFHYAAPQSTKEVTYFQKSIRDTSGITTTNTSKIKKTFYHQLPLSVHYNILPAWSIGSGVVWNKFVSAITEQDVSTRQPNQQADSLQSRAILPLRQADSNFVTSYFQLILESQFRWKKITVGVRYAIGLQPYLKFHLPGGNQQEEKNNTLQLYLRYSLWQSKKK
jgi:hypothetical protein